RIGARDRQQDRAVLCARRPIREAPSIAGSLGHLSRQAGTGGRHGYRADSAKRLTGSAAICVCPCPSAALSVENESPSSRMDPREEDRPRWPRLEPDDDWFRRRRNRAAGLAWNQRQMSDNTSTEIVEPLAVRPKAAWRMLGCGNSHGYEL